MLEVKLLGQFDVRQDGQPVEIGARPAQSLLAYLLLNPGTAFRREKLAGLLWPDATEANARNNLRNALWRLRQALAAGEPADGHDYFLADNFSIAFDASAAYSVDVAVLEGSRTDGAADGGLLASVLAYQGELLPGFYDDWVVLERERLQALYERKLGRLLEQLVSAARWPEVREWGERWVALGSAPEPAYRALMIAHAELGDISSVAAVYARCVEALRLQLDVEPSEQTRLLFERLSTSGNLSGGTQLPQPAPDVPPFKGLQYFDEADAGMFFGREQLTARLAAHLRQHRFLAVVGASGSGKSSVVRAGLVPALRQAGGPGWGVAILTPTAHPLEVLAVSLTLDSESVTAAATLMDDLAREPRSLHLAARRRLARQGANRLLLVVDQFEELFTLCRSDSERAAFVDNLLTAVETDGPLSVVITLRADFYAHCAPYPRLRDALEQYQAYIGPMSADELRQAIEEPARQGGWELEAGLVQLLLHEVSGEPGALPLLSHALLETWQRRRGRALTLGGYAASGGVRGAIAKTAESVYQQLSPEQQVIARGIFLRLTELGEGTQDTRRRAPLAELLAGADDASGRRAATEVVLRTLADARLITVTETAVEVAHEALIREWPALRDWLNENREALRLHRHLTEAAQAWDKLGRDPGELYRGARLAQALERGRWAEAQADDLNLLEREFLLASQELAEREAAEREAHRQRELQAAQELAQAESQRGEEQTRAAGRLRTRNRVITGVGTVAVILALAAAFFGARANQNAVTAQQQSNLSLSRLLTLQGASLMAAQDYDLAELLSLEALSLADTREARDLLLTGLQEYPVVPHFLHGHQDGVNSIVFSPDSKMLASGGADGTVRFWDAATFQSVGSPLTEHTSYVNDVAFSPDGRRLASASHDNTIILWDVATRLPIGAPLKADTGSGIITIAFSPDGLTLASGGEDGTVRLWDVATGQPIGQPLTGHTSFVSEVAFSPDGRTLASGSYDHSIMLWDVATRQPIGTLHSEGDASTVYTVAYSHDSNILASGSGDGSVTLWDMTTRQPSGPRLTGHTGAVRQVAFSPNDNLLASGGQDGIVRVWNVATGQAYGAPLAVNGVAVYSVAFSPDGNTLASANSDGTTTLWKIAAYEAIGQALVGSKGYVNSVAFSPAAGNILAAGDIEGPIHLWDMTTRKLLGSPLVGKVAVTSVTFSRDGKTLASGRQDGTIVLWEVATHQALGSPLTGHIGSVTSLSFSPEGKMLASGGRDGTIRLWDVATHQELDAPLSAPAITPYSTVAFSPDGKILASGVWGGKITLWDVATHHALGLPLTDPMVAVTSLVFSLDGKTLVSGSLDGAVRLWDVGSHERRGLPLIDPGGPVISAAISPDGKLLAAGSPDGAVRVWDMVQRQTLGQPLIGHTAPVKSIAFSPDSKLLASSDDDGTIWLWDVSVASWKAHACAIVGRNLSQAEWAQYLPGQAYQKTCAQWPAGN